MNILHITSIVPAPIKRKEDENDILIRIAQEYQEKYPEDSHYFIFLIPYSNLFTALFKKKWKDYRKLRLIRTYKYENFDINVLGIPTYKNGQNFQRSFAKIGYYFNKSRIRQLINCIDPDLIHAHSFGIHIELAQVMKDQYGIDYVTTIRGEHKTAIKRLKNKKLKPKYILSINKVRYNKYQNNLPVDLKVIPHPVEEGFFLDEQSLSKSSRNFKFVSVGRLLASKYYDRTMKVLSNLNIEYSYDLYGDGPELNNLKNLAKDLKIEDKVTFHGRVPHQVIQKEIREYDLLLQTSYPETLGRVYFEAMASKVPVIASKNTGIDGLIVDGEEGFLVDHNNEEEILQAIQNFISLSKKQRGSIKEKAYKKVSEYRWDRTLQEYYKLYHNTN